MHDKQKMLPFVAANTEINQEQVNNFYWNKEQQGYKRKRRQSNPVLIVHILMYIQTRDNDINLSLIYFHLE